MAMPKGKTPASSEIYQIKITLLGSKPPIWRRLLVPAEFNLGRLHDVLQAAMGWQDSHLHDFRIGSERYGVPDPEDDVPDERKVSLADVLGEIGGKAVYTYDFGDGWEHSVVVEDMVPRETGQKYPICVTGKGKCPPEDCGGIYGYYQFLEAINDPNHPEHEDMVEWYAGGFDPKDFSVDDVNEELRQFQGNRKKTATQ
jgi:hypothetical protein